MKKTDNYGAIVEIENIAGDPSKVDKNSLFTLLTRLAIGEGRIFDMGIILAWLVVMINIRDTLS